MPKSTWEKSRQKLHWVSFVLVFYCWAENLPLSVNIPCLIPLETIFYLQGGTIAERFLLKGGSLCLPPHLSTGTPSGLNLCRPCACFDSLWAHSLWAILVSICQLELYTQPNAFKFHTFLFGFLPHFTVFFSLLIGPWLSFGLIFIVGGKDNFTVHSQRKKCFD